MTLVQDMTLHRSLRLTTVAASLQWLRRLPFALRRHGAPVAPEELPAVARAEVQEICQQSLPHLMRLGRISRTGSEGRPKALESINQTLQPDGIHSAHDQGL